MVAGKYWCPAFDSRCDTNFQQDREAYAPQRLNSRRKVGLLGVASAPPWPHSSCRTRIVGGYPGK